MKYCRFVTPTGPQFGLIETVAGTEQITHLLPLVHGTRLPDFSHAQTTTPVPLSPAALRARVHSSKIVCVGRNYRDHAKELGNEPPTEPLIFFKPPSSIIGPGENIVRPKISERVDYEAELGVIIKEPCRNIREDEDVRPYILGYTCVNDVTARDLQKKDDQWARAKGFDTFCPVGPVVVSDLDPWKGIQVEARVNGAVRQSGNTRDFIFALDVVI